VKRLDVLKSRKTAVAALILAVLIFTPVGVRMSFSREFAKVESMFYNGIYNKDDGYTAPPLYGQILECQNSALGLLTVAPNYHGGDADTLRTQLREARDRSLDADYNTRGDPTPKPIIDRYQEFIVMYGFTALLYDELADAGLSMSEQVAADDYIGNANSAFSFAMQQASELSEKTERLRSLTHAFPMWFIGGRGVWFRNGVGAMTPADDYGTGVDGRWQFQIIDGEMIIP
jgi:hypothetical protein